MSLATLIFLGLVVCGVFALRRAQYAAASSAGTQVRRVRVRDGYDPPAVHVEADLPVRLLFCREETAPCSERVVFPDYGISVGLPPFQEVAVDLPASEAATHRFCCDMDMLHGELIVEPRDATSPAARPQEAVPA